MDISNIDDLLMGNKTPTQPEAPEHQYQDEPEPIEEMEPEETPDYSEDEPEPETPEEGEGEVETDEYGNEKERMPKGMKDRLDRKEKQHRREIEQRDAELAQLRAQLAQAGASREIQQAAKDFEFNPDAEGDIQDQLSQFIRHEISNMTREQQEQQRQASEQATAREFQQKFKQGMDRFNDFTEVVSELPMDDAMTLALRGMQDPSAFLYAAAKRQPQEIERIAKLRDPYARMVEMGKLEERMRKNKPVTKAPRPLGRASEDAGMPTPKKQKQDTSGDDLLASADAKRLQQVKQRHKVNR